MDSGGKEVADALAIQPDGKIVVAGSTSNGAPGYDAAVYRLFGAPAPVARITGHPGKRIRTRKQRVVVKFAFRADAPASFRCRIDLQRYKSCGSPKRYRLRRGKHRFQVRASSTNGTGPTASFTFKIEPKRSGGGRH